MPEYTLSTSAHATLPSQFHCEHQSSDKQCIFAPLRINLHGEFPSSDFGGTARLTPIVKLDSSGRKEPEPTVSDEWVGYGM